MSYRTITPRHEVTGERLNLLLDITDEQYRAIADKSGDWELIAVDRLSGTTFNVRAAPCGLTRCFCDALAIEERGTKNG